jgi:alpha-beta hydrolase superfamily lysophospholipase
MSLLILVLMISSPLVFSADSERTQLFHHLYDIAQTATTTASSWRLENLKVQTQVPLVGNVEIRAGYFQESLTVPFRGNILYLEGLGDSFLNHNPLFAHLSSLGYRVIAFDYQGQGGSSGTMNHTRILDKIYPALQISTLAQKVWDRFIRRDGIEEKIVLGWSTGGLAAYEMAASGKADRVILIAPGIVPRLVVGKFMKITLATLTRAHYAKHNDPHVDPIRPDSPMKAPLFAMNLIKTSMQSRGWEISQNVKGLVFLGGAEDRYVVSGKTQKVLQKMASHFRIVQFPDAYHEIDNEIPKIRDQVHKEIEAFLSK